MILPLIHYINFLNRYGKSLFFRNYGSSEIERDFLDGFSFENFTEFKNFIENISQNKIKSSTTDQFKYFYRIKHEIIIVVCTDLEDGDAVINSKINSMLTKFTKEYGELLKSGTWTRNHNLSTKSAQEIDEIILGPLKVSIIGLGGTGKQDLVRLICGQEVNLEYQPTINVDIRNFNGEKMGVYRSITVWDFAGQSNFRDLWLSLLNNTDIALLVFDSTFGNVNETKNLIQDILYRFPKKIVVIGIANKQDMPNRLSPAFIEKILFETGIEPTIKVHGMIATNPDYREKIHSILRDAIAKLYQKS